MQNTIFLSRSINYSQLPVLYTRCPKKFSDFLLPRGLGIFSTIPNVVWTFYSEAQTENEIVLSCYPSVENASSF